MQPVFGSVDHLVYIYCLIHSADCTNYFEWPNQSPERMSLHIFQASSLRHFSYWIIFFFFKHSFVGGFSEAGTLPRLTFSFGDVVVNDFFCEKVSLNVTALPFLFPRRGGESEHVEDAPVRGHGRRHGQSLWHIGPHTSPEDVTYRMHRPHDLPSQLRTSRWICTVNQIKPKRL